jgi:PKD repeat protein
MKSGKSAFIWLVMAFALLLLAMSAQATVVFDWSNWCLGSPCQFTVYQPAPATIAGYLWNFGDPGSGANNTSNLANPTHMYANAGNYTVTLTVTKLTGPNETGVQTVIIAQPPTANFTMADPTCSNDSIQFIDLSHSPYPLLIQWIWQFGDGSPNDTIHYPENPNVKHKYLSAGAYYVSLTVMNYDSCPAQITKVMNVLTEPVANFFIYNPCVNTPVQFNDLSYTSYGYITGWHWDFGDGSSTTVTFPNNPNVTHTYPATGTYTVSLSITTNDGCTNVKTKAVTVHALPGVDFTATGSCVGDPVMFTPDPTVTNINAVAMWNWTFGDGMSSNMQNTPHIYALAASYVVTLTITDTSGCSASVSHILTMNPLPIAAFSFPPNTCAGSPIAFTNLSTTSSGYITEWTWQFGDGTQQTIQFPNYPDITHFYSSSGTFGVTLIIVTSNGCSSSITYMVQVYPVPVANFANSDGCSSLEIYFTDLSQTNGGGTIVAWNWDFGNPASGSGNTSTLQNPVFVYPEAGVYTATLIVTNLNGCQDNKASFIYVADTLFEAAFTFTEPQLNTPIQFTNTSIPNGSYMTEYYWDFGNGITSSQENPIVSYSMPGYYTVTLVVSNAYGCSDMTDTVLYVPAGTGGNTLNGMVYAGNTAIGEVTVQLVQVDNANFPLAVQSTTPGPDHSFVFENIPDGLYYLRAKPATGSSFASFYLPTFYENAVYWEDATLLNLGTALNPYDIHLVSYNIENSGNYIINGQLVNGDKSLSIADQVVLLLDENNIVKGWTLTDINGNFSFADLPAGTYGIYPEITGLTTYPYFVLLNEDTSPVLLQMLVSGQTITVGENPVFVNQGFRIFPNPANEILTVTSFEMIQRITIFSSQGNIFKDVNNPGMQYRFDISQLPGGVCFVKVLTAGNEIVEKVVVIH